MDKRYLSHLAMKRGLYTKFMECAGFIAAKGRNLGHFHWLDAGMAARDDLSEVV
jgi:hypothetical protein